MKHPTHQIEQLRIGLALLLLVLLSGNAGQLGVFTTQRQASRGAGSPGLVDGIRPMEIQQLRVASRVALSAPDQAIPALSELARGALGDDVRQRAAAKLLDAVTRSPGSSSPQLDATLRWIYISAEDRQLRQRALLLLLARQVEELPAGGQGAFLAAILPQVLRSSRAHQLPPSVALGQAVLESGWGRSRLARDHNNLFGVKAGRSDLAVAMSTTEHSGGVAQRVDARFRTFDGLHQSIEHHARLLAEDRRYADARDHWVDWRAFLDELAPTYATDPAYARRVSQVVERYGLDRWDGLLRAATAYDAQPG
jgi:flagellum-specific peptidoglycan hydrolase FlgJ